jgi:hypothetical protein
MFARRGPAARQAQTLERLTRRARDLPDIRGALPVGAFKRRAKFDLREVDEWRRADCDLFYPPPLSPGEKALDSSEGVGVTLRFR